MDREMSLLQVWLLSQQIKSVSCNDVQNAYMIDAEPYVGKGPGTMDIPHDIIVEMLL